MKFLVYGSQGWIGSQLIDLLINKHIYYYQSKNRVDNIDKIEQELKHIKPTHVVCLIGRTHGKIDGKIIPTIDYLENDGKLVENIRDNLFSPVSLAILCQKYNIHLTYLGTGCIFTLDENEILNSAGFDESDIPNFFGSSYSIVKGFTDRLMHLFEDTVLNLRIRMPIVNYHHSRNFITKITQYQKICSIDNSMTYLPEMLPIALDLAIKKHHGTINLTNPGVISHNQILKIYKEKVDNDFNWKNFNIEEQDNILKSKRSNNKLNTKILQELYPEVNTIHDAINKAFDNYIY